MFKLNYHRTKFVISSPSISKLPIDNGLEVAFVGCSNAGKSSLINALCNQRALAKTSSTPGRTQLINLFSVAPYCNLVDLPGYGYAAVPEKLKIAWQKSLGTYLEKREYLAGVVLLMDSRHPLKALDIQMITWAVEFGVPLVVVLTKTDKLTQSELMKSINLVNQALVAFTVASEENPDPQPIKVIPVSSVKKRGLDKLEEQLNQWFEPVTSKYEELGVTDLTPVSKEDLVFSEVQEEGDSALSRVIASPVTKGYSTKQRYSPTARRLGTSERFVDPKQRKGR